MAVNGTDVLNWAISQFKNLPYTWGNNDCSGIVQKAYANFGISLPRVSSTQWGATQRITESQLQPGDLVFYDPGTSGAPPGLPGHVAIYAGGGMTFQALNLSTPIGFGTVHDPNLSLMGFGRVPGVNGAGATGGTVNTGGASAGGVGGAPATPPPPEHTGATCAIGFHNNIPVIPGIYTQTVQFCLVSKPMARSWIAGGLIAAGVGVSLTGIGLILAWGADQTKLGKTLIDFTMVGKVAGVSKLATRAAGKGGRQ